MNFGDHLQAITMAGVTATAAVGICLAEPSAARAEPVAAAGVEVVCPATGPGIVVCATAGLGLHEVYKALTGQNAFGPNGEVMKILVAPVKIVGGNIDGAARESGEVARFLRATTGISIRDIEKYGLFGGPNSIFRKPFG